MRPLSSAAVAAARRVLADADVRHEREIHIEAIAARQGAFVVYGALATARARLVKSDARAIVRVDARARGTAHARLAIAHELGHFVLHDGIDPFDPCVGEVPAPRTGRAWRLEREANDFAAELLIPERLGAPFCRMSSPRLDDVERLARRFKTSPEMSAIRFVQLASAPCAAVLVVAGKVRWATESARFSGRIVRGRAAEETGAAWRAGLVERVAVKGGELWWVGARG